MHFQKKPWRGTRRDFLKLTGQISSTALLWYLAKKAPSVGKLLDLLEEKHNNFLYPSWENIQLFYSNTKRGSVADRWGPLQIVYQPERFIPQKIIFEGFGELHIRLEEALKALDRAKRTGLPVLLAKAYLSRSSIHFKEKPLPRPPANILSFSEMERFGIKIVPSSKLSLYLRRGFFDEGWWSLAQRHGVNKLTVILQEGPTISNFFQQEERYAGLPLPFAQDKLSERSNTREELLEALQETLGFIERVVLEPSVTERVSFREDLIRLYVKTLVNKLIWEEIITEENLLQRESVFSNPLGYFKHNPVSGDTVIWLPGSVPDHGIFVGVVALPTKGFSFFFWEDLFFLYNGIVLHSYPDPSLYNVIRSLRKDSPYMLSTKITQEGRTGFSGSSFPLVAIHEFCHLLFPKGVEGLRGSPGEHELWGEQEAVRYLHRAQERLKEGDDTGYWFALKAPQGVAVF